MSIINENILLVIVAILAGGFSSIVVLFFFLKFKKNSGLKRFGLEYPIKNEVQRNNKIFRELVSLKTLTNSSRAYIFRFHNGLEFLPSHPVWKLSCTHEITSPGVTYEAPRVQSLLVSLIPHIIFTLITGSPGDEGVKIRKREDCPHYLENVKRNKRILVINPDELKHSYCRFFVENKNAKTMILCGIADEGNVYGAVGIDFCDRKLTPEEVENVCSHLCKYTDIIQYGMGIGVGTACNERYCSGTMPEIVV